MKPTKPGTDPNLTSKTRRARRHDPYQLAYFNVPDNNCLELLIDIDKNTPNSFTDRESAIKAAALIPDILKERDVRIVQVSPRIIAESKTTTKLRLDI